MALRVKTQPLPFLSVGPSFGNLTLMREGQGHGPFPGIAAFVIDFDDRIVREEHSFVQCDPFMREG